MKKNGENLCRKESWHELIALTIESHASHCCIIILPYHISYPYL